MRRGFRRSMLRLLRWLLILLLLAPSAVVLACRYLPVPVTPLMLLRAAEGLRITQDWVDDGEIAAARAHFGHPARRLTPREAALLAAVLPNPRRWSPARPTAYILSRAERIEARMAAAAAACR